MNVILSTKCLTKTFWVLMAVLFLFLPQIVNLTVINDVLLKYQTTAWEKFPKTEASFITFFDK